MSTRLKRRVQRGAFKVHILQLPFEQRKFGMLASFQFSTERRGQNNTLTDHDRAYLGETLFSSLMYLAAKSIANRIIARSLLAISGLPAVLMLGWCVAFFIFCSRHGGKASRDLWG
ncbi:hypothetical protein [Paraburkholderia aspalathi]|uniref:hypothetical protein n=1 Tax=Paraburkholderia aspalathi TaxID=1324617 RepID=UPI0038B92813